MALPERMPKLDRWGWGWDEKKTNMTKMFLFKNFFFSITQPGNIYLASPEFGARGETWEWPHPGNRNLQ